MPLVRSKEPFEIETVLARVRQAVSPYPKAGMFELYERGHTSLFAQLAGCMLSIRSLDEVVVPVALKLLDRAPNAKSMLKLSVSEIEEMIASVTFAGQKARWLSMLAQQAQERYGGEIPADPEVLTSFTGIGPKCAHLALGVACQQPFISVDIHVHRICNRWGYVSESTPEKTLKALEAILPKAYWIEINALLVPFGKHICTGKLPQCSTCPLEAMCQQVAVERHR